MPAKRLPWFKMWPEAMRHEKIALLSDALFRTWVKVLADGSEQAVRWRFANVQHAASVTGRPAKHIRDLIDARLLDDSANGEVWVHDWRQWQDRYESEFTRPSFDERSANAPRTLPEDSLNAPRSPGLDTEERLKRRDTERELEPEPHVPGELVVAVAGGAGGAADAALGASAPPKPKRGGKNPRTEAPETLEPNAEDYAAGERVGLSRDDVDSKAVACLDYWRARGELRADWHASLREWLNNSPKYDQPRGGSGHRNGSSRPPPALESRDASKYFETRTGTLPRR